MTLVTFRLNAGLPTSAKPYGGWEAPEFELGGHSLGHYLSACALCTRPQATSASPRERSLELLYGKYSGRGVAVKDTYSRSNCGQTL